MSEFEFFDEEDDDSMPTEEMAVWVSEFMSSAAEASSRYRQNYCAVIAHKVFDEFGIDGFCELLMAMDARASWISDILFEASDLDDIMFKKYGVYDQDIIAKARRTKAIDELNSKIWRLRRKYAKLIVDEVMSKKSEEDDKKS